VNQTQRGAALDVAADRVLDDIALAATARAPAEAVTALVSAFVSMLHVFSELQLPLALLKQQCVASHPDTRGKFLAGKIFNSAVLDHN
jgi:hypothetical protein